tara:strand:+ start:2680 stop:2994 length:315 start_codon:yes stop_codon:yes gene_type:complete
MTQTKYKFLGNAGLFEIESQGHFCKVSLYLGSEYGIPAWKQMGFHCTAETLWNGITDWLTGESAQDAFPFLDRCEREFLITGLHPEEWDTMAEDVLGFELDQGE